MPSLRFELTVEDIVAFNRHYQQTARFFQRRRLLVRLILVVPLLVAVLAMFFSKNLKSDTLWVGVLILPLAGYLLLYSQVDRWIVDRVVRRMFREGANKALLGLHEVSVSDEGIVEKMAVSETKVSWETVERVAGTPEHTMIYIGAAQAIVVPKNRVVEGNYVEFVQALTEQYQRRSPHAAGGTRTTGPGR